MKRFTSLPAETADTPIVFDTPRTKETAMSTFENVAFGLMMGSWLVLHGLYALQVISLY
ncbi:MAG: hypothetical protein ACREBE_03315 [bacterium]